MAEYPAGNLAGPTSHRSETLQTADGQADGRVDLGAKCCACRENNSINNRSRLAMGGGEWRKGGRGERKGGIASAECPDRLGLTTSDPQCGHPLPPLPGVMDRHSAACSNAINETNEININK